MGKIRVDELTDELGTGSPAFPNGVRAATVTDADGTGAPEFPNGIRAATVTDEAGTGAPEFPNGIRAATVTDEAGTGAPSFPFGAVGIEGVPTGAFMFFAMNTAPTGWLKANGAAISRTTYSALFDAIGTTFGAGDGSTTFNLPDMRGEFPRGWDDGRGVDSGRAFGSNQGDDFRSHSHSHNAQRWFGTRATGSFTSNIIGIDVTIGHRNASISSNGGSETRPRNIALLACIKF